MVQDEDARNTWNFPAQCIVIMRHKILTYLKFFVLFSYFLLFLSMMWKEEKNQGRVLALGSPGNTQQLVCYSLLGSMTSKLQTHPKELSTLKDFSTNQKGWKLCVPETYAKLFSSSCENFQKLAASSRNFWCQSCWLSNSRAQLFFLSSSPCWHSSHWRRSRLDSSPWSWQVRSCGWNQWVWAKSLWELQGSWGN